MMKCHVSKVKYIKAVGTKIISNKVARKLLAIAEIFAAVVCVKKRKGGKAWSKQKGTILVVSHEASATGAPILAWNICKQLSDEFNIITIILRNGQLTTSFKDESCALVQIKYGFLTRRIIEKAIDYGTVFRGRKPIFAIVNSIVAANTIQPICRKEIPVICLVHEFGAYIRPIDTINRVALWSNTVVFSTDLTRIDLIQKSKQLNMSNTRLLPQGRCKAPLEVSEEEKGQTHMDSTKQFYDQLDEDEILVLGAGQIQPRKGVDLFISVACQIERRTKISKIKYAWIGSGYEPQTDYSVSIWLEDQIEKSGLSNKLVILPNSPIYEKLIKRAKIFLMTSRLDPLPNVAIDALSEGTPVHCFDKASGIAYLLSNNSFLTDYLIARYMDTHQMSLQACELLENSNIYQKTSTLCKKEADATFNMDNYIERLKSLGNKAAEDQKQITSDCQYLRNKIRNDAKDRKSGDTYLSTKITQEYIMSWKNGIWPRKPEPGFHPGIYREKMLSAREAIDPYVHYLQNGKPKGVWKNCLITPESNGGNSNRKAKTALHIHIHYPELAREIIHGILYNKIRPELYITYNKKEMVQKITMEFEAAGLKIRELIETPNKGRDIGPLITCLGKHFESNYDIYGHIHTKKSELIGKSNSNRWRRFLIANLLGTRKAAMADIIVEELYKIERLGVVFPEDPTCIGWCNNKKIAMLIGKKIGINSLPDNFEFPVGNMFWAKSGALTELYDTGYQWEDYPSEPIGYDGTMLHAIERLIPMIAERAGYTYQLTHIKGISR